MCLISHLQLPTAPPPHSRPRRRRAVPPRRLALPLFPLINRPPHRLPSPLFGFVMDGVNIHSPPPMTRRLPSPPLPPRAYKRRPKDRFPHLTPCLPLLHLSALVSSYCRSFTVAILFLYRRPHPVVEPTREALGEVPGLTLFVLKSPHRTPMAGAARECELRRAHLLV
jgi:hypothetical protein